MEKKFSLNEVQSPVINKNRDEDYILRYSRILNTGLRRTSEAMQVFEERGSSDLKLACKAFYHYLSVKKAAQRVIMEKVAYSLDIEISPEFDDPFDTLGFSGSLAENEECLHEIFETINEAALSELEFYLNYLSLEKDPKIKALLCIFADLSKEFLFDLRIWYINHKTLMNDEDLSEEIQSEYLREAINN